MVWKKVINGDTGDADHFGGDDIDKISDAFSGVDVDDFDINLDCKIRSAKLQLRNPANTFAYIVTPAAIAADRILNLPLLTGTDTLVTQDFIQTLTNKTLGSGTVFPATVVKTDQTNVFGDFNQDLKDNRLRIFNPTDTFAYTHVAGAISAARNINYPVLTADDTLTFNNFTATLKNKTIDSGYTYGGNPDGNIIKGTGIDNPFAGAGTDAVIRRTGMFIGTTSTQSDGILGGSLTAVGTPSAASSSTEGYGQQYATGAVSGNNSGWRQATARFRREWGTYMIARILPSTTTQYGCFFGFSSDTGAEVATATPLDNLSGVGLGRRSTDANWQIIRNDGDAATDYVDTGIAFAASAVTLELELNSTNLKTRIGGVEQTAQTTELPATTTNLAMHFECETLENVDKNIQIFCVFVRTGT